MKAGSNLNKKKLGIYVISFAVIVILIAVTVVWTSKRNTQKRIEQITANAENWKQDTMITPQAGSLKAAGYMDIEWNPADELGNVEGYKVYADGELIAETDKETTKCEFYTTKVSAHEVYVETDLEYGSKVYSNIYKFYVNKKGLCVNKDMAKNIEAPDWGTSWYYNWAIEAHRYTSFQDMEFVPMMWTSSSTDKQTIGRLHKFGYKYVLAFNEPDLYLQSNIEVDRAVEGMKAFMNQNIRVGSPATALCPPWSDEWFQPFMKKMKEQDMDVDFIPIHHYWNWFQKEGAEAFLDLVKQSYEMYHKPIWITEFAISGDPGKTELQRQKVIDYMNMVIPELDKLDYVERYAWFSFNPDDFKNGASALMKHYEGTITDLGYLYQKIGMPEGYGDTTIECNIPNTQKDIIK